MDHFTNETGSIPGRSNECRSEQTLSNQVAAGTDSWVG